MTANEPQRRRPLPNPFFVLLLGLSCFFVVTCFAYLISPTVLDRAREAPKEASPASVRFAEWLDRNGPYALGAEFLLMTVAGTLAMATDRWFPEKPDRKG